MMTVRSSFGGSRRNRSYAWTASSADAWQLEPDARGRGERARRDVRTEERFESHEAGIGLRPTPTDRITSATAANLSRKAGQVTAPTAHPAGRFDLLRVREKLRCARSHLPPLPQ